MIRTKFFRTYLVDHDQPWWHNRLCFLWGRKPKPVQTSKGIDEGDFPHELRSEWRFCSRRNGFHLGVKVEAEDGRDVTFHFGVPWLLSIYVTHTVGAWFIDRVLPWYSSDVDFGWRLDRELSVCVFDWSVMSYLWVHPMDSNYGDHGRTKISKWRTLSFSVNPLDLLGRRKCTTEIIEPERVVLIPMPEGDYCGLLKVERRTWRRKLWPWWPLKLVRTSRDIECPDGIPFSGKGDNSWDCGEDGIYGTGFEVRSDEEACALFAASALQTRKQRGDPRVWPESPGDRAERITTMRTPQVAEPSPSKEESQ